MLDEASGLTTVRVIPTAARCAAWRCASGAAARYGIPAGFGRFSTTMRGLPARSATPRISVVKSAPKARTCASMYPLGSLPPAPAPRAAVTVLISLRPAKIVTSVAVRWTNGISCSMKLPAITRLYCWPSVSKSRPMTAVGSPRFKRSRVNPCTRSWRAVTAM
ncbi:MAG: hypothetical protein DMF93_15850 [Acidobacteria bacterium]|nr:MAG: hypothetical protein DMF93_15850 [Acidobacteriota bacterium]